MLKKIAIFISVFITGCLSCNAETIKAIALEDYSTAYPKKTFAIQLLETHIREDGTVINAATIVKTQVIKLKSPTRGKRDAYFEVVPVSYLYNKIETPVTNPVFKARVVESAPLDAKEAAKAIGKSAAGLLVKGASQGISLVEGMVNAEEGNRISSGLVQVYKDSPLAYVEKGQELEIHRGEAVTLKIYDLKK